MYNFNRMILWVVFPILFVPSFTYAQHNHNLLKTVMSTEGLIACWDFKEPAGNDRVSDTNGNIFKLKEQDNQIPRVKGGPLSGYAIALDGGSCLSSPYEKTGALNIKSNQVNVVAWSKRLSRSTGFIGGMWNEYSDGGKRQYGLFTSLPHYNGRDQVCGHVSKTGKPTPPFPYSIDYSGSGQIIPHDEWVCVAFTYDGTHIRSYLNGAFEYRAPELIENTRGFEGFPEGLIQSKNPYYFPDGMGNNGSDFTVGAVFVAGKMGNFFKGEIGGLAVFDRALSN